MRLPLASGLLTGKYKAGHVFADNDHRTNAFPPERLAATLSRVEKLRFLAEGTGRTLAQAALKFCLAHPAVSVVIPGVKTPEQAAENVAAALRAVRPWGVDVGSGVEARPGRKDLDAVRRFIEICRAC